ncbi:MAG: dTDP-4-dehydrorhamnose 3,5-epimerase [Sphingobacteriia bacterium]|nr:dTDP-4-dehydrorhamnose 3,5-epimerase [Sphingobacteriia bacterium]
MKIIKTEIEGLVIIKPTVFEDSRGYFFESFREDEFKELNFNPIQDNESFNYNKGTLRGLHLQQPPFAQAKLIRCIKGEIIDVAVDLRPNSPTFGKHYKIILNENNKFSFFIPKGFAHGYITLSDETIVFYKVDAPYNKSAELTIKWDDEKLGINWDIVPLIISEKDQLGITYWDYKKIIE